MNGAEFNPRDATRGPRNTLGEDLLFIGDNYPIAKRIPPSVHDTEGLPFMTHGCGFIVRRGMNGALGQAIPDLSHFRVDGAPTCSAGLARSADDSRSPPPGTMPTMNNARDGGPAEAR